MHAKFKLLDYKIEKDPPFQKFQQKGLSSWSVKYAKDITVILCKF